MNAHFPEMINDFCEMLKLIYGIESAEHLKGEFQLEIPKLASFELQLKRFSLQILISAVLVDRLDAAAH